MNRALFANPAFGLAAGCGIPPVDKPAVMKIAGRNTRYWVQASRLAVSGKKAFMWQMPLMRHYVRIFTGLVLATMLAAGPAMADDHGHGRGKGDDDHDLARELYEHGDIRPLEQVLAAVAKQVPGDVVAVDLTQNQDDHWIYVVQVVTADGTRVIVDVDAANAVVLKQPNGGST